VLAKHDENYMPPEAAAALEAAKANKTVLKANDKDAK
jgi:cytochrome c-type biogenesis protein CcmE